MSFELSVLATMASGLIALLFQKGVLPHSQIKDRVSIVLRGCPHAFSSWCYTVTLSTPCALVNHVMTRCVDICATWTVQDAVEATELGNAWKQSCARHLDIIIRWKQLSGCIPLPRTLLFRTGSLMRMKVYCTYCLSPSSMLRGSLNA